MPGMVWAPAHDALLMELVSQDMTFAIVARRMRLSRNQVMGRFDRLRKAMGWQAS